MMMMMMMMMMMINLVCQIFAPLIVSMEEYLQWRNEKFVFNSGSCINGSVANLYKIDTDDVEFHPWSMLAPLNLRGLI